MKPKTYNKALTIAGSDSGGGAGIQADLKTFSALGCYGSSVLTALTAQNTLGVNSIFDVSPAFIREQLQAVLSDLGADAVKIGMLHRSDIIEAVAEELISFQVQNIVLDPVMYAKSGHALLQEEAISALREKLIPISTVVTPNLPEAEKILNWKIETEPEMIRAGFEILEMGPSIVVIKGGHLGGFQSPDCVCFKDGSGRAQVQWFSAERIETRNTHGTGCTFSSAIAAGLAKKMPPLEAIGLAKNYLTGALTEGAHYQLGEGHGPVHHFHNLWRKEST